MCLVDIDLTWTEDNEHREVSENVDPLIIQAWRTYTEGNLLGFVFGAVEPGHRRPIVNELLILLTELLDDLPLDIISHCDLNPVPHILSRSLVPYLQWSACLEGNLDNDDYPSHNDYLNPQTIAHELFNPGEAKEGEEEEEEEEEEQGVSEEEEANQAKAQEEDLEAERQRAKIAEGKRPLEQSVGADLPIPDHPTRDPEPPVKEDEHPHEETSGAVTRRQRSHSPSPSPRPSVRARGNAEHRTTSLFPIPPSP
ncbi:hypothetical protein CBR_g51550 [Chara braunii]|uniref:Uncharacterized protein n=1 Tax=Chara braunii TaxID=69332 RepID=A0A388M8S0_CHABU|nr:hypothetical protein CBR_g51550 [Chara braunii]|eukprot:GBG90946.1 hypothetical protein CBR_g51550 [Chara braunii]